ncbi:MAG: polyprenyl synthetase family protein [Planctomycetaceae bacterium]|nr:polyprenyl synthetase family protein [Planctomycetaceae bacterium]
MTETAAAPRTLDLVVATRATVVHQLKLALTPLAAEANWQCLLPGKMLRTRLVARLSETLDTASAALQPACAAVELVHTASLCHDDVIDAGVIRRSMPTLWQQSGCSAAVLIGDLLLCRAIALIAAIDGGRLVGPFIDAVAETCAAEARQELLCRNRSGDVQTCLHLARGKSGAFFAFAASLAGGGDPALSAALTEVGYCLGTAYQLGDDLLDITGSERQCGKTLGTDAARKKPTLAAIDPGLARRYLDQTLRDAFAAVAPWPAAAVALAEFLEKDIAPLISGQGASHGRPSGAH